MEKDEGRREDVKAILADIATPWQEAADQIIVPDESAIPPADRTPEQIAESVAKGRELFYSATKGNCLQCHGPTGLGDGQQTDFDDWSKINKAFIDNTASLETEIGELQKQLGELDGDVRDRSGHRVRGEGGRVETAPRVDGPPAAAAERDPAQLA